jgi:hypothetical protein
MRNWPFFICNLATLFEPESSYLKIILFKPEGFIKGT